MTHLRNDDRRKRSDLKLSNTQDWITALGRQRARGKIRLSAPGDFLNSPVARGTNQSHVKTTNFYPAESRRRLSPKWTTARVCTTSFPRWTGNEGGRGERAHLRPSCVRSRRRQSNQAGNRCRNATTWLPCDIHRTSEDLGRAQGSRDFRVPPFHARESKSRGDGLRLFRTSFSPCEWGMS
jgi:hypothetical protein